MSLIKKIKLPNEEPRDIGALSSNVIYDGDAGVTTTLNDKIQSIFTAIGNINSFEIAIVSQLPATGDDHTIYFVPESAGSTTHNEYMYIDNQWELIGTTTIDLSNYLQKSDISVASLLSTGTDIGSITLDGTTTTFKIPAATPKVYYGVCDTAAATPIKTVTVDSSFELVEGAQVTVRFINTPVYQGMPIQLDVNETGAKTIYKYGTSTVTNPETSSWYANSIVTFTYNGSNWVINNEVGPYPLSLSSATLNQGTETTGKLISAQGFKNAITTNISYTPTITSGEEIGTLDIWGTAATLYAPTYSLSMSGPTITLTPSSGTASTITLPIWDGTVD